LIPDLQGPAKIQCFPLYLYDVDDTPADDETKDRPDGLPQQAGLFAEENGDLFEAAAAKPTAPQYQRRDAITDEGLSHFQAAYPGETISKEDLFYYVYGLLHSPDYRERYADNLSKELPRIPCVKTAADFWGYSQAGRQLADLHLNYETVTPYPATVTGDTGKLIPAQYRVEKMKYGKQGKDKDLSTVHYNALITVSGIPLEAYEYVVNGKSAIDWVMERQCFKVDKDSGIVNDANDWAVETMGNPRYPLELLLRVVTVSVETVKIVKKLPKLDI
jgi:predicted helicase